MSDSHSSARENGQVKSVTPKGYGFIRRTSPIPGTKLPDLFVHAAECNNAFDDFKPGTHVEFSIGKDKTGRDEAKDVRMV